MLGPKTSFAYFEVFYLKIPMAKIFSLGEFSIISKCFEFQNIWLKIIRKVQLYATLSYTTVLKKSKISDNNGTF